MKTNISGKRREKNEIAFAWYELIINIVYKYLMVANHIAWIVFLEKKQNKCENLTLFKTSNRRQKNAKLWCDETDRTH